MAQVVPETPLDKAVKLVEKVLKDANSCRSLDCTIISLVPVVWVKHG